MYSIHDDDVEDGKDDCADADHVESVRDLRHAMKVEAARIASHPSRALAQKSLVKIMNMRIMIWMNLIATMIAMQCN